MNTLTYFTGNASIAASAQKVFGRCNTPFTVKEIPLVEIQFPHTEDIALYKARDAFRKLKTPVLINDAEWSIPSLNSFPGAYLHHISQWLTNEDFLNLMREKLDRSILRTAILVYKDKFVEKVFTNILNGIILVQPEGSGKIAFDRIISFRKDKKSVAQCDDEHIVISDVKKTVWDLFVPWYTKTVLQQSRLKGHPDRTRTL
jgi:XTP/dITP diphosphohydrolase